MSCGSALLNDRTSLIPRDSTSSCGKQPFWSLSGVGVASVLKLQSPRSDLWRNWSFLQ
jgi:hypothetical protein